MQKVILEEKPEATGKSYAHSSMASQFAENNSIKGKVASATLAATGSVIRSVIKKLSRRFHLEVEERHDKQFFLSN